MIELLERVTLGFEREESPQQKLRKLEGFLVQHGLLLAEVVPLFAALFSLPLPVRYPPDGVARAAEAADVTRPPHDLLAQRHAAAGALCHGRPALGRSDDPGIAHPPR